MRREPAEVRKVSNHIHSVQVPVISQPVQVYFGEKNVTDTIERLNFTTEEFVLHHFGKYMSLNNIAYDDYATYVMQSDFNEFYQDLVDNCKHLFIDEPVFNTGYDTFTDSYRVGWTVRAGGPELDFFNKLFADKIFYDERIPAAEIHIKEVLVEPHTVRECLRCLWKVLKNKFRKVYSSNE